jgi:hypothetical protein
VIPSRAYPYQNNYICTTPSYRPHNMASNRQYDLVLLGPTGYTGRLCSEHIVQNLPTDLKWAIAGRSPQKIEPIAEELKKLNSDRVQPGMAQDQSPP